MTITIKSLNEINVAARSFLNAINGKKIIAFYGEMAVGKTTFIKALCEELEVEDAVVSPLVITSISLWYRSRTLVKIIKTSNIPITKEENDSK